jgi:hydrogenase maturation protease
MNQELVDKIARAVLYEGYMLYPYRPSVKNRQRWTFGGVYPQAYSLAQGGTDACTMQTECLVRASRAARLEGKVRFLHLQSRIIGLLTQPLTELPAGGEPAFRAVERLQVGDQLWQTWQEAVEREVPLDDVDLSGLAREALSREFAYPAWRKWEPLSGPAGEAAGVVVREQEAIAGTVELSAEDAGDGLIKVRLRILNRTPLERADQRSRDEALMRSLVSTHTVLGVRGGEFISLLDPPELCRQLAAGCRNEGTWPVLVGELGEKDTLLSSPIILADYPQVAPESPGDLFDATEIDEILTLRILALTDEEKRAMAAVDERARALLHRTETLTGEQLLRLHGVVRGLRPLPTEDNHE